MGKVLIVGGGSVGCGLLSVGGHRESPKLHDQDLPNIIRTSRWLVKGKIEFLEMGDSSERRRG